MANEKTKTLPHHEKLVFLWNSVRSIVSDLDVDDSKLTEEHEIRIKRYYDQLLSNLNVPDVATHMFKIGKLSARDHEHLRQFQSTPIKASEELLNIIITNTRDVYECFLESLKRTKQHHVYQMLISEEDDMCMDELSVSEHSRLIRLNYDWLTESLDPDSGLLSTLYAKEVLNKREYAQIFCEKDRFIKNEGLLSAISRKTVEDFNKFIVALNATLQGHITKKLFKKPTGETFQVVVTTKMKTMPTACFHEFEKRIPPRPPPKPKKQTPALPSIEPVVIKPLLKPKINQSQPNLTEKQQWVRKPNRRKQSAQYLGAKLKALPNELQTEVSTKIFLIHQRESTDSLWKITFTKILEDSRNIRTQFLMYAKAADEKCERLMQEINRREREYQVIKEDIKREKINSKAHLRQVQGAVNELEGRLNLTENENRNLLVKLKKSEIEGERLKALNKRKEQEANVQTIVGGEHQGQIAYSEMEALLKDARKSLIEKDHALTRTTKQLKETQEMLKETKVKLDELKALLMVREKRIDNLEVLNQRKEQKVNEYLCIIEKLEDHIAHSERKLQEAEAQLKDTNYKLMEKDISLRETSAKFEDFQKQLNVPHTDRDSLKSEDYSRAEATFRYTVNNISKLKDGILSPPFYVRNLPWKIMAMLKTSVKTPQNHSQKNFGFFLQCNGESDSKTWSCNGAAELKILNQKPDGKPVIRKIKHLFFSKESDWGFSNFIPMSELLDPKNDYVKDDSVTLEVYVKADAPHGVNWDFKHHKALFGLKDEGAT